MKIVLLSIYINCLLFVFFVRCVLVFTRTYSVTDNWAAKKARE
jgi:hypothetical protein